MKNKIRKKGILYGSFISFCCLFLFFAGKTEVLAAVTEGKPGDTVSGEYAVIVNTNTVSEESTGTLVFDGGGSANTSAQETQVSPAAQAADGTEPDVPALQENQTTERSAVSSYTTGEKKTIISANGESNVYVCIGEGEHCYIWMSEELKKSYDAAGKTAAIAKDMAATYDGVPYQTLNAMAGGTIPCQDHTGKLSVLLETLSGASGVYKSDHGITAIHIHAPEAAAYQPGVMESRNGLLVHEGQHALFHLLTAYDVYQPYTWLNEGLAVAAMDYIWGGTDNSGWLDGIAGNTDIRNGSSLIYSSYRNSSARDYGMPYLFVRYLITQKAGSYDPMAVFPLFYKQKADCTPAEYVEKVLGNGTEFSDILTDFYTAVIAQEAEGKYGFAGDTIVSEKVKNYPLYMGNSNEEHILPPTGAIIVRLQNGTFTIPRNGGNSIRYMIVSEGKKVSTPAAGDGTLQNPYIITSFKELNLIGGQPDAYYRLENDIDTEGKLNLTVTNFRGVLDGNGHVINGLKQPLTGRNSGTIRNLTIKADFNGEYTGIQGIFTQINEGLISDSTAEGTVTIRMLRGQSSMAETAFGGIAGINNQAGAIRGCGFTASVSVRLPAAKSQVGGIAGIQQGNTEKCYSRGNLTVTQPDGETHDSYVSGASDSYDMYVGGLAGEIRKQGIFGGSLSECVHTGSILASGGNQAVGQLCGMVNANVLSSSQGLSGHLTKCYARQNNIPAIGYPTGEISEEGILLSEEDAKNPSSYQGWDFKGEWKIDGDGPIRFGSNDIHTLTVTGHPEYCYVGEKPFNWGTLQVNGGNGSKITDDMISNFNSNTPGQISVTVSYLGKSTTFSMEIREPKNVSELKAVSRKNVTYHAGEYFNPDTVYLLATLDGMPNRMIYSGFSYDKKTPLTPADTEVVLSYYGGSVAYPITVEGKSVTAITVADKMSTTCYQEGQKLDLSGIRIQLIFNNGEKSELLSPEQFESYGIRLAKSAGSAVTDIRADAVLKSSDNKAEILLYTGDKLPGNYGAVFGRVGTLTVYPQMILPETTLHLVSGQTTSWLATEPVTGGSGNYTTQVIKENLPPGISRVRIPGNGFGYFEYRGKTTAAVGSVWKSTYRIEDTITGANFTAVVEIRVHASNEASFFRFNLLKSNNPGLENDVIGEIGENKIVLKVPTGTDVSKLQPDIDFGYHMGVSLPQQFWNGSIHDFTSPVIYTLTAPDGVTKKSYTVYVEFTSTSGSGSSGGSGNNSGSSGSSGNDSNSSGNSGNGNSSGNNSNSSGNNSGSSGSFGNGSSESESKKRYPSVGTVVKSGALRYRVTKSSAKTKTVEVKGLVKKKTTKLKIPATVKINGYTYRVTAIGKNAFLNNKYLKKITIGKYVTSVKTNAFKGCKKLTSVSLPQAIQTIGDGSFSGCTGLKKVTVGKSLKTIGKNAFLNCKNLRTLTLRGSKLRSVGKNAVKGIYKKAVIRVPKKSIKTYKKLFLKKTGYVKSMKIKS